MKVAVLTEAELEALVREAVREALELAAQRFERQDRLLTRREAAEMLDVSEKTISNWISDGTLPHIRRGGRVYVRLSDLLDGRSARRRRL